MSDGPPSSASGPWRRFTAVPRLVVCFIWQVIVHFVRNRGLLLASAIAHNTLLTLTPLAALVLVGVSFVVDAGPLQEHLALRLQALMPGGGAALTSILSGFLQNRGVVGITTVIMLGMFGVMGIRVVGQALDAIFGEWEWPTTSTWRRLMVELTSALLVGFALVALAGATLLLEQLSHLQMRWIGLSITSSDATLLARGADAGIVVLVAALYWLLAPGRIRIWVTLCGGLFVAVAWQVVENVLEWFFRSYSYIGVLYGSLAGLIIVLVSLELAAVLFLLGAQGIALIEGPYQNRRRRSWRTQSLKPGAKKMVVDQQDHAA